MMSKVFKDMCVCVHAQRCVSVHVCLFKHGGRYAIMVFKLCRNIKQSLIFLNAF